jgi:outer membrane protein OmpA-like peptidoglycan-associated protein
MLVPTSNTNLEVVRSKVMRINPRGKTPIAKSIREARQRLGNSLQKTTILLISDGLETCGGNPCAEAKRLKQSYNADVKIYSVGYSVDDNTREQLQCISSITGGQYFDAKDSFALDNVVYNIVRKQVTKAFDADGDGVINDRDRCPNTLANFSVDEKGCEVYYTFKIHFDHDSDTIKPEFISTVKQFANYMKTNNYKLQLQGNTDSTASNAYNKKLSDRRAKAVMKKLIGLGISSRRLSFVGYGEERPIADNFTSWGRFKNRRVEAHIIKF